MRRRGFALLYKKEKEDENRTSREAKLIYVVMDLLELPSNILITILLSLPAESVCCIRCVCKPLLNIVDDLFFVTLHRRRLHITNNNVAQVPHIMSFPRQPSTASSPHVWFLQPLKYDGRGLTKGKHANITVSKSSSDLITYATYCHYTIDFVFCNLISFREIADHGVFFLFNPLKGEVLRLPRNDFMTKRTRDWYGMGFDNMTNNYKIIRISRASYNNGESCFVAQVLVLGTSSWREIPSVPPGNLDDHLLTVKNVCAHGDMHWLIRGDFTRKGSQGTYPIVSFDFGKEEFYWTPHPLLQSSNKHLNFWDLHLLTLRGSMALACITLRDGLINIEIWVLKDYDKKEWTQDHSLNCKILRPWNDLPPRCYGLEFGNVTCGEWEDGMFLQIRDVTFFLDHNRYSINRIEFGSNILSYSSSLISLKDYRNQFESTEAGSYADLTKRDQLICFQLSGTHNSFSFTHLFR